MDRVSRQLGMFPREASTSTLLTEYVPILLLKRGEREALGHLTSAALERVTPWMRVVPPELRSNDNDGQPAGEFARLASVLRDRAVYLDVIGTPRRRRALPALDADYLDRLLDAATAAGLAFAPVYPLGREDVAGIVARHTQPGLGAAVLLTPAAAITWGTRSLTDKVRTEVGVLGLEGAQVDLMVDLGYLRDGADDLASAAWFVRAGADAFAWRSIIVAGTSVPDSLADEIPDDSLNGIERREARLFDAIQPMVARPLRFGDYGVQHPVPPAPNAVPKMRASIRYTVGDYMFVSRGGRPIGEVDVDERAGHYQELATRLRDHPPFAGASCCWGDETIEAMADGRVGFKSQQKMRAIATCHHIAMLAAEREAASGHSRVAGPQRAAWPAGAPSAIGRDTPTETRRG